MQTTLAQEPVIALDMTARQWRVLFAAWLGWGFDVFDALLFNYVAANCIVSLMHLTPGTAATKSEVMFWTGVSSSVLLVGCAAGGILFGRISDRIGRSRTMIGTMILYAVGTASCALAPNFWVLLVCRAVSALGIGGEWAAGASMVAEVVPEKRRVQAGALLYSSAPVGLFLATFVNWVIAGVWMTGDPGTSWRWVFAFGILPAGVAILVRRGLHEPERWTSVVAPGSKAEPARFGELFNPTYLRVTISGLAMAVTAMLMWWASNAFIPVVAGGLGDRAAAAQGLAGADRQALIEGWKTMATNLFNLGGLIGTFATVPIAERYGRRTMYGVYFALSAASLFAAFGVTWPEAWRLYFYFPVGLAVFGVFGSFTYYLPELFPTRLRSTGAGFCYNSGRIIAAGGPFLVGWVASRGANALDTALAAMSWIAVIPLLGLLLLPLVVETKGRVLED